MMSPPVLQEHGSVLVLRDDLLPGGTKRRVASLLLAHGEEFVYASPACGYAQVALAYACTDMGKQATIFTAQRSVLHPRTQEARQQGAKVVLVRTGYLTNVQAKARAYAALTGATFLPFGFDT